MSNVIDGRKANIEVITLPGITVLPDEDLGGVLREYREVSRKADVGERIKTLKACDRFYRDGDIASVVETYENGSVDADFSGNESVYGGGIWYVGNDIGYVVLEPTDIVRVDGARYRMVEREAEVGEKVIVVSSAIGDADPYFTVRFPIGTVGEAVAAYSDRTYVRGQETDGDDCWWVMDGDYRVLEPLSAEEGGEQTESPEADRGQSDPTIDSIANLAHRVYELELHVRALQMDQVVRVSTDDKLLLEVDSMAKRLNRAESQLRVAREDIVLIEEGVAEHIREVEARVSALEEADKRSKPEKSARPFTRDEVIAWAKADVAELERTRREGVPHVEDGRLYPYIPKSDDGYDAVHYEVNREKRTVVALIKTDYLYPKIWARGIAKCAPGEVFNVHIGKAIALRRALGLEVPDEYVNAPQPTEPRVGDIVDNFYAPEGTTLIKRAPERDGRYGRAFWLSRNGKPTGTWLGESQFQIIDDSRTGTEMEDYSLTAGGRGL